MPRTRIPANLIHRPEEVERNAERFDNLCRLAEEVAFPVVQEALFREYHETAATGVEALTEEAKRALETLVEEVAVLEELDEKQVLSDVQRSLSEALPMPDEEESRQHARDFSQVLMSNWLEILREAQSKEEVLLLSDCLIPELPSAETTRLTKRFGTERLPYVLTEALASFAVNGIDVGNILTTLRVKLFSEPRLVDLPFDLAMMGTYGEPVLVLTRSLYDELLDEIDRQLKEMQQRRRVLIEQKDSQFVPATLIPGFVTIPAQQAVVGLSEPLSGARYGCFARVASFKAPNIEARVR